MFRNGVTQVYKIQLVFDILLLLISFTIAYIIKLGHFPTLLERDPYSLFMLYVTVMWFVTSFLFPVYTEQRKYSITTTLVEFVKYVAIYVLFVSFSIVIARWHFVSREMLILFFAFFLMLGALLRISWRVYNRRLRLKGKQLKNILIIGTGQVAATIESKMIQHAEFGYKIKGFLKTKKNEQLILKKSRILGDVSQYQQFINSHQVNEVVIAVSGDESDLIRDIVAYCDSIGVRSWIIPDFFAKTFTNAVLDNFDGLPILRVRAEPLESSISRFLKRSFDLFVSVFVMLTIFPLVCLIILILNKFYSPGPLFFKQPRHGQNNHIFHCYKFRSMHYNLSDKDEKDFKQATKNDPRISSIGKILRKTNLDELAQIINVLKGEMSIVGPRPHPIELNHHWKEEISKYLIRHFVKPGVTGWAQVKGFRGETETKRKMQKRVQYDIWYIENWSFGLDLKIIALTALKMLKGDKAAY